MAKKWMACMLAAVLLLGCFAGAVLAEDAERSITVRVEYDGAWVNITEHLFKIFLPDGWELVDDGEDDALMTVVDPETGNRMWIESLEGEGFTMDGVYETFSQEEGLEDVQKLYINGHAFVHYVSPEENVRGFITLTADAKHILIFKFSPADDEAFTHYAEMIMSTLSAYAAKTVKKSEKKEKPTLVMTWAELVAAAKAGKTKILVGANLTRGDGEETAVFHKSVTIKSADGNQYVLDGNGEQIIRVESDTGGPLTGTSEISGLVFVNGEAEGNGGALFVEGDLVVEECVFVNNTATGSGGAIYVTGDLELAGTLLAGNTAGGSGGGAYAEGDITLSESLVGGNEAGIHGGGVYAGWDVTVEDSYIVENTAGQDGGGVYASSGDAYIESGVIAGNEAGNEGGGVNAIGVVVNGGAIVENEAGTNGGGIYAFEGDTIVNDGVIADNTAAYGGGIYADHGADVIVNGGEISGNTATETDGGNGVYADGGTVTVNGGNVTDAIVEAP